MGADSSQPQISAIVSDPDQDVLDNRQRGASSYRYASIADDAQAGSDAYKTSGSRSHAALSVSAALELARSHLEGIALTVIGELSDVTDNPRYKAVYFSIRDKTSVLPCVMWRRSHGHQPLTLKDGMLVEVSGHFSLYAAKGRMQFDVRTMVLAGEGQLRLRVAQLADKLQAQGFMDPGRKLLLPELPQTIALVTSPRGKAVHDVLRTLKRRYRLAKVLLFGTLVEGKDAPARIIKALHAAGQSSAELILLVRGGGSYEDLMPFNDEQLALAIADSPLPIITGIGHEPDTTIADMVASLRTSTPTAAAEAVAPDSAEILRSLEGLQAALLTNATNLLGNLDVHLASLKGRPIFADPDALLRGRSQYLEQSEQRLTAALPAGINTDKARLNALSARMVQVGGSLPNRVGSRFLVLEDRVARSGLTLTTTYRSWYENTETRMTRSGQTLTSRFQGQLERGAGALEGLSPLAVLRRGYALVSDENRPVLASVTQVTAGQGLNVRLRDGIIDCLATKVREETL
ncbi:MAG: exodeoxyribonuclease VII large subunit [Coriobacteriales bacterium]|jgi:exodeoxyribonuclease VII large subunit|nr:exodeoxyribonuclease VII large subunit [Coriobacteriales bacterium]